MLYQVECANRWAKPRRVFTCRGAGPNVCPPSNLGLLC